MIAMDQRARSDAMAPDAMTPDVTTDVTPTAAMPCMTAASAGDLYETRSSQLALNKSRDPAIRQFAQMIITDHVKTTATLRAQARSAGLNPPAPMLPPMRRDDIACLTPLTGEAFDRAHTLQQGVSHRVSLDLDQTDSTSGDTSQVRLAASSAVPIVQSRIALHHRRPGAM